MKKIINSVKARSTVGVAMSGAKSLKTKVVAGSSALLASGASFAEDHTALITTASTEGSTNVLAVIGGVIGIAILGFGVSAMISWFRR
jgi:hypothetical protein